VSNSDRSPVGVPVFARPGTSDLAAFQDVFARGSYDVELSIEPQVVFSADR
jgi:hypothetical protein